jgi:aromatic-L-amino-acid decarboxylase
MRHTVMLMDDGPVEIDFCWPRSSERVEILTSVSSLLSAALEQVAYNEVAPRCDRADVQAAVASFDFNTPLDLTGASRRVIQLLSVGMVHTTHPAYFGLFNPTPTFPGIVADLITAHFNPQLAVWSHAPIPVEIELRVIAELAKQFGWPEGLAAGHFTSGGAEANHSALLLALTRDTPGFAGEGSHAFTRRPCIYASEDSHLAWLKIAHAVGIGRESLRLIPTDGQGRMNADLLRSAIELDAAEGRQPVFIAATAGTTNAGMIDPLNQCADIARFFGLWLHVDAAWGGAIAILPEDRSALAGIELADSITVDAHKWFSVPMGAGILLCRHASCLADTFHVSASYMPSGVDSVDPYTHSMQWSRRFIGLKLFLSLACMGWEGYRRLLRQALKNTELLQQGLCESGWRVVNDSPLAVLCFVHADETLDLTQISTQVADVGRAWISVARFQGRSVLRACATSHLTGPEHVDRLVSALNDARRAPSSSHVDRPLKS